MWRKEETMGKIRRRNQRPVEESKGLARNLRFRRGRRTRLRRHCKNTPGTKSQDQFSSSLRIQPPPSCTVSSPSSNFSRIMRSSYMFFINCTNWTG
ncbi:hypothetical protein Ahy_A07g031583 isoform A [Arachis hypogaea]|uniref:Uncharacterized protein n=1 Tax=Arachis hypogaea TaxID=3818 RepID=A0A445C4F2_ARAHY|nr:hypothetical protein Ahy_A07g031583 isoform A [Arachis hypogaea]